MKNKSMHKLLSDRSGIAAVEFALVAPIFFALIFSIFEAGWVITKIALVENAVEKTARGIYTGAVQNNTSITPDTLIQDICDGIVVISDCSENVTLDVRTIMYLGVQPSDDVVCRDSSSPGFNPVTIYDPGASSEITFIRVCVTTELFTPFLGLGLALPKNANDRYEIVTSLAFANEPF